MNRIYTVEHKHCKKRPLVSKNC